MKEIPSEAKALIGKETVCYYHVTEKEIKRFAQAIDDPNPLYVDEGYAKNTRYGTIIAPPLFCQVFAYDEIPVDMLREDGIPTELEVPLPTKRAVGGGSSFEIGEPVRVGDVIKVTKKITDIYRKKGKSGDLYFVLVDTLWTNQHGQLVSHEIATYIHH